MILREQQRLCKRICTYDHILDHSRRCVRFNSFSYLYQAYV